MRFFSVALVLCLYLFAVHASFPLHMWSNTKYFDGKHIQIPEIASSDDVKSALRGEGPLGKYLKKDRSQPEAIVVFLEPERVRSSPILSEGKEAVLSELQQTIAKGTSSMSVHVASPAGADIVMELIENLPFGGSVTLAKSENSRLLVDLSGRADIKTMTHEELKNVATSNWNVLSNGVTDLVIVCLDSQPANVQALIHDINGAYVNTLLGSMGSSYLAIFTQEQPDAALLASRLVSEVQDQVAQDSEDWGAELIEAVIVMIPFLFILLLGICCTFNVQSELKFDLEKKKR